MGNFFVFSLCDPMSFKKFSKPLFYIQFARISEKIIFPAIDITKSGTRREELLFDKNDLQKMNVLRRIIAPMGSMDAIEFINSKLKATKSNSEFFTSMNKPA